ncbi:alpha/beta fold hydrolase [Ohtaekwangia kribbensis]|uniref:Alpha/beta fold hydrolase n=1 Tax=Ohtaekwangia kribbensis TaxID=688913 RepID=A0ABW3JZH5_9BACT
MNESTPELFYTKLGNGKDVLLLFHGFGQDNTAFTPLARSLSNRYTCYIFDLYFHGKSKWAHNEQPLEKKVWRAILQRFLHENQIDSFSLLGYSMGGKFVLATLEAYADKVTKVFLLAPDGVKTNFWYYLATYPVLLRKLFKSMIHHQDRFLSISRTLNRIGIIDKSILRFAEYQMNTTEKRERVYYSWVVFRKLKFNITVLATLANERAIPVTIIVGKYDKVITPASMNTFVKQLHQACFIVIEAGHNFLTHPELAELI